MPYCECGEWVTAEFVQVFAPNDADRVEECIECAGRTGMGGRL